MTLFQKTPQATLNRWMANNAKKTSKGLPWITLERFVAAHPLEQGLIRAFKAKVTF